jgi:hypothetical protein
MCKHDVAQIWNNGSYNQIEAEHGWWKVRCMRLDRNGICRKSEWLPMTWFINPHVFTIALL